MHNVPVNNFQFTGRYIFSDYTRKYQYSHSFAYTHILRAVKFNKSCRFHKVEKVLKILGLTSLEYIITVIEVELPPLGMIYEGHLIDFGVHSYIAVQYPCRLAPS